MNIWIKTVILLGLGGLISSCATLRQVGGFHGSIEIDTSGYSSDIVETSKRELIEFFKELGLEDSTWRVEKTLGYKTDDLYFERSGFGKVYHYNLFLNRSNRIGIGIRDSERSYPASTDLKKEIERLIVLLSKYYREEDIKFEILWSFLA